jgi:glucokinase
MLRCFIGIDVGGTKIAGGLLVPENGTRFGMEQRSTDPHRGGDAVLRDVIDMANNLATQAAGYEVAAIGLGVPELVSTDGEIRSAAILPWRGMTLRESLSHLAPRIIIESDVRAASCAEAAYGSGSTYASFVYVSIGTGISCTLVNNGKPYAGARGHALILASGTLVQYCPHCGKRSEFVLESFASGSGIVARYNQRSTMKVSRTENVIAAAHAGDELAAAILTTAGEAVGSAVGQLVNVLDPYAVIVGGGLGSADGLYWESLQFAARAAIWSDEARNLPILHAALRDDAGWIGAALSAGSPL